MRYHDITKEDMRNGDGLRVVLWVSGCSHKCPGCQNPVTWDPEDGLLFDDAARQEIYEQLEQEYISGITFSGGDPLFFGNRKEVGELITQIRERFPDKTIWIYTGYCWEKVRHLSFMKEVDVCVDGRFLMEEKDNRLRWKGSRNQRVIDVKATFAAEKEGNDVILHCEEF